LLGVGGIIAALGLVLRAWSAGTLEKGKALATSGPYAHTRNPLYLGSFAIAAGLTLAGGHWAWPAAAIAVFAAVYVPTMRREARRLSDLFGMRYAEYAAEVPAFVPRLTPYRAENPDRAGFTWSRYFRYREWEASLGAVAAFVVLWFRMRLGG
jgi:protein-S-isoprenylcysteine O-methyltransferase Ste14